MWGQAKSTVMIIANEASTPSLRPAFLDSKQVQVVDLDSDCLQVARKARPGLIIEDFSGSATRRCVELCHQFKSDPATREIPVVVVVYSDCEEQAREARADAILRKPIVQSEYFQTVSRFMKLPRRREPRSQVNLRFQFEFEGRRGQAFSRDVSPYGAYLKTDFAIENVSRIRLRFQLPGDAQEISCLGDIRRTTPLNQEQASAAGFAVEFIEMASDDQKRMREFLARTAGD